MLAEQWGVTVAEARERLDREAAFSGVVDTVIVQYPEEFVAAEWFGDFGLITVADDVVASVSAMVGETGDVDVVVDGTRGPGIAEIHRTTASVVRQLQPMVSTNFSVVIDGATGTVSVQLPESAPAGDIQRVRDAAESADGTVGFEIVVEGPAVEAYSR